MQYGHGDWNINSGIKEVKNMRKIFNVSIVLLLVLSLSISFALASEEETFAIAEGIVKQKTSCDALTEDQLEIIGDYLMEQMHPGEWHEIMDERMGGEGSENLRRVHIRIARSFYCGEYGIMSAGMMNMMMGRSFNINQGGGWNMMGYYGGYGFMGFFGWIFMLLILVALILLIIWLVKQLQNPKHRR